MYESINYLAKLCPIQNRDYPSLKKKAKLNSGAMDTDTRPIDISFSLFFFLFNRIKNLFQGQWRHVIATLSAMWLHFVLLILCIPIYVQASGETNLLRDGLRGNSYMAQSIMGVDARASGCHQDVTEAELNISVATR